MITLIMPVRARWDLAERALRSLRAVSPQCEVLLIDDDGADDWAANPDRPDEKECFRLADSFLLNRVNLGLWQSMNWGIRQLDDRWKFCFFGCDVTFTEGWQAPLETALDSLNRLGLVWPRDDHQNHGNASHFMTTKRWLWVVYGEDRFPAGPGGYWHWFLDSELTCRSRDLGRAIYVPESHVPHHWEPSPPGPSHIEQRGVSDKEVQDRRHLEWVNGGLAAAQERLAEAIKRP